MTAAEPTLGLLAGGDLRAEVTVGALLSVSSLRHRGDELLVGPQDLPPGFRVHGRRAGITLLHPWANRLGADRFDVGGAHVVTAHDDSAVSRDDGGLAIHGLAVPGAWTLESEGPPTITAVGRFVAVAAFPFAHEVTVRLEARPGALLVVTTTLRATGVSAVPVAFGWHPYFRLPDAPRGAWRLGLPARRRLKLDPRGVPRGHAYEEQEAEDRPLRDRMLDDGFAGLEDGVAFTLAGGGRRIGVRLTAGYPAAQVFAPREPDVVSLEPMTAPTDALRSGHGLRWATSAAPFEAAFTIQVDAAAPPADGPHAAARAGQAP